ncbi:MAG: hypothetical protein ACOH1Y_10015 [Propionicimonas sp.]
MPASVPDMAVPARVAWTYLGVVLALFGTGLIVVFTNMVLTGALCPPVAGDDAGDVQTSCQVGFLIWSTIAAFLLCLMPTLRLLKLDWWLWAAVVAGAGFLVAIDAATEWWWWACAALIPAIAALISADWSRGARVRRWQLVGVLVLDAGAIAALAWWYFAG